MTSSFAAVLSDCIDAGKISLHISGDRYSLRSCDGMFSVHFHREDFLGNRDGEHTKSVYAEIVWKDGDSVVFNFAPTDMAFFRNRINAMVRRSDPSDQMGDKLSMWLKSQQILEASNL